MKSLATTFIILALTGAGVTISGPAMADEHGKQAMHHGMHHGSDWKESLSDKQQMRINKLKLDYKKKVYPIKAKLKQAKIELALLTTSDTPNQNEINRKIDEITKLKGEKMRLKAAHKIEVRKILNDEQRVLFDLHVLKKAYHGKSGGHHGYH